MERGKKQKRFGTVIFDDLAFKLTPSERIVFGIIHRYSGYKLGECRLKPMKIAELAGVSRSTVYNVTKRLAALGMIEVVRHQKQSGAFFRALRVVKDTLEDDHIKSAEFIEELEAMEVQTKSSVTHVTMAEEPAQYGDEGINDLFNFWLDQVGIPLNRIRKNRQAAANLIRQHGPAAVRQAIAIAGQARFSQFAPSVSSFIDLQSKWSALHLWAEKRAHEALLDKYEAMSLEDRVTFKQQNPELAKIITAKREAM